jgi:phosphoribosylformylglycinamidine (FGAM) synthase-like enzyme
VCCSVTVFSAGIGQIDHRHLEKADGEIGMLVVKIGGPAYRIGMGGGAASSVPSGSNKADLDFNAVQVRHCILPSTQHSLCIPLHTGLVLQELGW